MRSAIRNGVLIKEDQAVLPVTYREVQYSFSVYEALRITSGHVVHLDDHLKRLAESCREISLLHPFTDELITTSLSRLIEEDEIKNATARILLVGGPSPLFFITYSDLLTYPDSYYTDGVGVTLYYGERFLPTAKTSNLLMQYLALEDAKSKIIIRIMPEDGTAPVEYAVPKGTNLLVRSGDVVKKADKLVDGDPVPQDILRILGQKALATFMVEQIQQVYRLQGVSINDKHIEILIREMTRRVEITNPGDTGFLMGQVVDRVDFEEENARVIHDGGRPAESSQVLVGLTRASLTSRSFISNASFQQTTKVLVDAAISGATDKLVGINENLIVGRLIPVGTGAYVRRVREIAKEEEKAEKLAREGNAQQQLLDI